MLDRKNIWLEYICLTTTDIWVQGAQSLICMIQYLSLSVSDEKLIYLAW